MVSNKVKWNQTVYTKKFRVRFHLANGNDRQNGANPHEYRLFLPVAVALDTGLILFVSARYSQENNPKRTSKTALLNDKFSRAVFCLSYLFFRQETLGSCFPQSSQVAGQFSFHSKYSSLVISPASSSCWRKSHSCINSSTRPY